MTEIDQLRQRLSEVEAERHHFKELYRIADIEVDTIRAEQTRLREAMRGILDIGKRDMSNPKYDGYFEAARAALSSTPTPHDKSRDQEALCQCGHPYYRHFDTYEDMRPVGCKYCDCGTFSSAPTRCEAQDTVIKGHMEALDQQRVFFEVRCEALTAERDTEKAERKKWIDWARFVYMSHNDPEMTDLELRQRVCAEQDATILKVAQAAQSRCQHLEQAVRALVEDLEARWDMDDPRTNPGIRENVKLGRAALASLLPSQEEPVQTDENRVLFAAGYTAALDDALKGKR